MLGKMGATIKFYAMMYKAIVQSVVLYGSRILVVTDAMMMVLEGFHNRITRRIARTKKKKGKRWGMGVGLYK